ncbi:EAL domain-containing protein, partial [Klebsiella pneumoniae]
KIDRSLVDGVATSAFHSSALKSLQQLASLADALLIAEGVESVDDSMVCRDIGIAYAQGYVLGKPAPDPTLRLGEPALAAI